MRLGLRSTPARRASGAAPVAAALLVAVLAGGMTLLAAGPAPAAAQQWTLDGQMGRLDFRLAPDATPGFTSLAVGLGFDAPESRFRFTTGVPTGGEEPLWGAVDSWQRLSVEPGAFVLGVDLLGQAFAQRYTSTFEENIGTGPFQRTVLSEGVTYGYGAAGQVMPLIGVGAGPVAVEARAGFAAYRGGLGTDQTSRDMATADLRVTAVPTAALLLSAESRWFDAPEGARLYTGIGAAVSRPEGTLWASVGRWSADTATVVPWGAGATLPLSPRLEIMGYVRQDDIDPLFGTAPRRFWGAGLRVALTQPPAPPDPVPAAYVGGVATIVLEDARGGEPRIAGDFNDWSPEPMVRRDGRWTHTVRLEPGVYEYAFVDADGTWYVPESVPGRRDDGMGGHVAILVVEAPDS